MSDFDLSPYRDNNPIPLSRQAEIAEGLSTRRRHRSDIRHAVRMDGVAKASEMERASDYYAALNQGHRMKQDAVLGQLGREIAHEAKLDKIEKQKVEDKAKITADVEVAQHAVSAFATYTRTTQAVADGDPAILMFAGHVTSVLSAGIINILGARALER